MVLVCAWLSVFLKLVKIDLECVVKSVFSLYLPIVASHFHYSKAWHLSNFFLSAHQSHSS
jgi:hypothetical protein